MTGDTRDVVDTGIVAELQEDGRRSIREIARNLSLSETTVRNRVKKMQESGGLQIGAYTNIIPFSNLRTALLLGKARPSEHSTLVRTLTDWPEVIYLSTLLGRYDFCLQISTGTEREISDLMNKVRGLPGIQDVQILPEVRAYKVQWQLARPD